MTNRHSIPDLIDNARISGFQWRIFTLFLSRYPRRVRHSGDRVHRPGYH
jgi:hypothetical protein